MFDHQTSRRSFLKATGLLLAAPAIVKPFNIMPVKLFNPHPIHKPGEMFLDLKDGQLWYWDGSAWMHADPKNIDRKTSSTWHYTDGNWMPLHIGENFPRDIT